MQPHRSLMLRINPDTHNVVVWVTYQFSGPLNSWWLTVTHAAIPNTSDPFVAEIRKTSLLPNIRNDEITDMLLLTQGSRTYAVYTRQFDDFLQRSRHLFSDVVQCVTFIKGLSNF
jgi:hypothetical protein